MKFEIYLSASLAYTKVFYSSIVHTLYMTCVISSKQGFFWLSVMVTTISSRLEEVCLSHGKYLKNIYFIKQQSHNTYYIKHIIVLN